MQYSEDAEKGRIMQLVGELSGKMDLVIDAIDSLRKDVHKRAERQDVRIDKLESALDKERQERQETELDLREKITILEVQRATQTAKATTALAAVSVVAGVIAFFARFLFDYIMSGGA